MCQGCQKCQKIRNSIQKEPLEADKVPERPFDVVSCDLFYSGGKVFMIFADRLSGYPMVDTWSRDPTTQQVKRVLMHYFSLFGKPLKFKSDGGSQFSSKEMQDFLRENGIQHGQSSPYNPQSNGHAERNVKIMKDLIVKTNHDIGSKEFLDGIIQIRNSPRADGLSPCQVVFGRSVRTLIPTLTESLGTNEYVELARKVRKKLDQKQKYLYDRSAKKLRPLDIGTKVWVQHPETKKWDSTATILSRIRKRTYQIQMEDGKITHRNRRWIRKCNLSDWTKPPNLRAGDDGDSKEHDGNEITDQNGINLPKKRSNRLTGKQKVDYKLLNGI